LQAPFIDENECLEISAVLSEFHKHKDKIIAAGARRGASSVLEHWEIPKLELMQSVAPSISRVSSLMQWSADTTECAHIDFIKDPSGSTNNQGFEAQICWYLDHQEKCHKFSLATSIREKQLGHAASQPQEPDASADEIDHDVLAEDDLDISALVLEQNLCPVIDYFKQSSQPPLQGDVFPVQTFTAGPTAFHLNYYPTVGSIGIEDVAERYCLTDLRAALVNYLL
jgi:hypothetical protein